MFLSFTTKDMERIILIQISEQNIFVWLGVLLMNVATFTHLKIS